MPLVTAYTEDQLAAFMHRRLGNTATALGWTVAADSYDDSVNATLRAYGDITTIAEATDMAKLEALAVREVWRSVVEATGGEHTYASGTSSFNRSDIAKNAERRFLLADAEARVYDTRYAVGVTQMTPRDNPYRYLPDELRVLP